MDLTLNAVMAVALPAIAALVWLLRLEGTVRAHDDKHKQHDQDKKDMKDDLKYVRGRMDELFDHLVGKK